MNATSIAAIGMQNDLTKLDSISHNLANVLTPGYKKQISITGSFAAQMTLSSAGSPTSEPTLASNAARLSIDTRAGTFRYTANPQDVAIDGDGFFEIAGPDGPVFTRQGSLRADAQGRLVGSQGLPVMGAGGEISVSNAPISIDASGNVRQGERLAGRIKVVRFSNPEALIPVGNGLYSHAEARIENTGKDGDIKSGFLENSNVNSAQEMVRLTETLRHYEAMQKIMQAYDDALDKTFSKLGEF